jgi:hypothetical protein
MLHALPVKIPFVPGERKVMYTEGTGFPVAFAAAADPVKRPDGCKGGAAFEAVALFAF